MVEVKNYRIVAKYAIQRREMLFRKDIRAIDERKALEKFYDLLGAHNIRRTQIRIIDIREIAPEEIKDRKLRKIATSDQPALYVE